MDKKFNYFSRSKIAQSLDCGVDQVYCVWSCKTLQNIKGLFSSDVPEADGMYYESTYNGDKKELYLDSYKKLKNEKFDVEF